MLGNETIVLGGEYIPLVNAARILRSMIKQTIFGAETLTQSFRHLSMGSDIEINSSYRHCAIRDRARFMNTDCSTMAKIRERLYTYRDSSNSTVNNTSYVWDYGDTDDDVFEPHSPPSNEYGLAALDDLMMEAMASTPVTDDEGYRSRLPTTASSNASPARHHNSSPRSDHTDIDWSSDIDFEDL